VGPTLHNLYLLVSWSGSLIESLSHLKRYQFILFPSYEENGEVEVFDSVETVPVDAEDYPFEVLQPEEDMINHLWDRSEGILYDQASDRVSKLILAGSVDWDCTPQWPSQDEDIILVDQLLLIHCILHDCFSIFLEAFFIGSAFIAREASVRDCQDVDIQFLIQLAEVLHPEANISRVFMEENNCGLIQWLFLVDEPSVQGEVIWCSDFDI